MLLERHAGCAVAIVSLVAMAACGSTVPIASGAPGEAGVFAGEAADDGLSVPQGVNSGEPGGQPGRTVQNGDSGPGAASNNAGRNSASADPASFGDGREGTEAAAAAPLRPPRNASGRGFTSRQVKIGFATVKDVDRFASAVGAVSNVGDQESTIRAVVSAINKRGGLAGRLIVPAFHDAKIADIVADPDRAAEAACRGWTEDHQVFAVVNNVGFGDEALAACMTKKQTPLVFAGNVIRPSRIYDRYEPYLYAPIMPTIERLIPVNLERAAQHGYFGGWDTVGGQPGQAPAKVVGVYTQCCSIAFGKEFAAVVSKELMRRPGTDVITFEDNERSDNAQGAVLQFRNAGVSHVITNTPGALAMFATTAESQQYRPRYLVSSATTPAFVARIAPAAQLRGALGVGFIPNLDVNAPQEPEGRNPAKDECMRAIRDAGQDTSARDAMYVAVVICDGLEFLKGALETSELTPSGLRRGAQGYQRVPSAATFGISYAKESFAGGAIARDLGFDTACGCFKYLNAVARPM